MYMHHCRHLCRNCCSWKGLKRPFQRPKPENGSMKMSAKSPEIFRKVSLESRSQVLARPLDPQRISGRSQLSLADSSSGEGLDCLFHSLGT